MKLKTLIRLFHTLKSLRPIQFYFRGYYYIRNRVFGNRFVFKTESIKQGHNLSIKNYKSTNISYEDKASFTFLNSLKKFDSVMAIDWNYPDFGKLWCYNLNYFDFLLQKNISRKEGLELVNCYISKSIFLENGLEPYPVSLRNMNWIKFLITHKVSDERIDSFIYSCYQHLLKNLEYHLLGNHLLENAYSLFIGAIYFNDEELYIRSKNILETELLEQILDDGAHFELSPMYHHILFERLLDCINFAESTNNFKDHTFLEFLTKKAELMLGWMKEIMMRNGDMPLLNDSTIGIAKSANELILYAYEIGIESNTIELSSSGYRKFYFKNWELIADAGKPGPDYIPGHAHSDIGNFILYYKNKPFIIDPGISTYEKNKLRDLERSTAFHNTVVLNNQNQSDVWGGFRLGKRAKVKILEESEHHLKISHNGYKSLCGDHIREFEFSDSSIKIKDLLSKNRNNVHSLAYFHLSKDLEIIEKGQDNISFSNGAKMTFKNIISINVETYNCPQGFNSYVTCNKLVVVFKTSFESIIF